MKVVQSQLSRGLCARSVCNVDGDLDGKILSKGAKQKADESKRSHFEQTRFANGSQVSGNVDSDGADRLFIGVELVFATLEDLVVYNLGDAWLEGKLVGTIVEAFYASDREDETAS